MISALPQNTRITGQAAIQAAFDKARHDHRATFMPFFMVGFPDIAGSIDVLHALANCGADTLEIGIPFSDPVADGLTNQHASQVALAHGASVQVSIDAVATLRERGVTIPLVLMGYVNPLLAYGLRQYVAHAAQAGASGFIVPDLPPEEAGELSAACDEFGLTLTPMVAQTSTPDRIRQVTHGARGFVYMVAVTGVTGARETLSVDLGDYVRRVRSLTTLPLTVGFGISTAEQVRKVATFADGVVVGSALIKAMDQDGIEGVRRLATELRAACEY